MPELFLVPKPSPVEDDSRSRGEALDISRSFLVEAPAGSGKTGLLIQRYLKLLADPQVEDPGQVLAITFTRKATVEMRDRVLAQLEAAAEDAEPANDFDRLTRPFALAALAQDRQLGWSLLEYPRRLNIRTIDSISAEIARSQPILSGAAATLTPTEDARPLHAAAARRTVMLLGGSDRALHQALELLLLHRDANLGNCESLIAEMLGARDQWGELIPLTPEALDDRYLEEEVLPRLEKALDQAICRALTRLTRALPEPLLGTLCTLAAEMGRADGYNGNPSPIAICAGRYQAPGEQADHLDHWRALIHLLVTGGGDFRKSLNSNHILIQMTKPQKEELKRLIDQVRDRPGLREALCAIQCLPPAEYPEEQWVVAKALFRILSRALVELQLVFVDQRQCDFTELALLARSALRRDPSAAALAQGRPLQHLLVDEMQDTSSGQYELIQLLTAHWDGHSQTVFLVGDPKQSIYLFRQARVERFIHTMHSGWLGGQTDGLPLTTLRLTANFRTQATLVRDFNADFSAIFPRIADPDRPELVSYLDAVPRRNATPEHRVWHASPVPFTQEAAERTRLRQVSDIRSAQQVRQVLEDWRNRPLPPGRITPWTIAVLVRSRAHLLKIVAALKQAPAIAFRAVEIDPLSERQEVLDLLSLTRALLHPADRTAWLALLRTPWVGLTLPDLHAIAGGDEEGLSQVTLLELIGERGDLLTDEGMERMERLWTVMTAASADRGRLPVSQWVERTWRSFGPESYLSNEELANLERFLELLDELEEPGGTIDLGLLGRRLGTLYAAPVSAPGAVDLMTIHGAKGLEWDVVVVPALERTGQSSRSRLLSWLEIDSAPDLLDEGMAHGILAPIQGRGRSSQELNSWMRSIETAREAAERKRLFYVAATRAREELHLFAAPAVKQDGSLSVPSASLLCSAWAAAEQHFNAAPAPIFQMSDPLVLDRLAADAAPVRTMPPRVIERIPLRTAINDPVPLPYAPLVEAAQTGFDRPEGSFAARAFGNTVHAFLDEVAHRMATGSRAPELLAELSGWLPRMALVLRASGLAASLAEREALRVQTALRSTLSDPEGVWIVSPHPGASSETSVFTEEARLRTDRTFLAGPEPLTLGQDCLWIVDYKTALPGGRDVERFLVEEQGKYAAQLESYGRALEQTRPVRLALYYPLIPRLIWWEMLFESTFVEGVEQTTADSLRE